MAKDVIIACDFNSEETTLAFLDLFKERKPFVKSAWSFSMLLVPR